MYLIYIIYNLKYIFLLFLVLAWTLTPFCKKRAIGQLTSEEYFVVNFIFTAFLAFLFWIYLLNTGKTKFNVFVKMTSTEIIWAIVAAVLSILSAICLIGLIKTYEVSHIMPQLTPCVIVLTTIFGYLVFGEKITLFKIIGILFILLVLILFSK